MTVYVEWTGSVKGSGGKGGQGSPSLQPGTGAVQGSVQAKNEEKKKYKESTYAKFK